MSDFSDYYENKVIDHLLRGEAFTVPTTIYVALFTANTGLETNAPTAEITEGGYARKAVTLSAASGGATSNSAVVEFDAATEDWTEATHFAIVDHETNSTWGSNVNVLMWDALTTARTCTNGNQLKFSAGALTVTIA
jgi:hypothetical protein